MDLDFVQNLEVEIDRSSLKPTGFSYDMHYIKNVLVGYKIHLHQRSWGLDMVFMCQDQDIKFDVDLEDLDSGDTINSNPFQIRLENIEIELNKRPISSQISPESLNIMITELNLVNGVYVGKAKGTLSF